MAKNTLLTWILIGAFLSFAGFLPLNHTCLELQAQTGQASGATGLSTGKLLHGSDGPAGWGALDGQSHSEKSDVCLACLWSRMVMRPEVASGIVVTSVVAPLPALTRILPNQSNDQLRSAHKRSPPPV